MIPEIGHFALVIAMTMAFLQCVLPLYGSHINNQIFISSAKTFAIGQFLFICIAFVCLTYSFLQDDFSVLYVANHSHRSLPVFYKIAAVWSAHEGSLLLWILLMSIWTVAVGSFSDNLPKKFAARVISVQGILCFGFLLFTLFTSNPFVRLFPAPFDGADLNPLLQDPGLVIHPPILYAGYVGFSVAFSFAIAAMITGDLDQRWARWTRPWTTAAWIFLTIGIALGSWWAYYELGWGGWWFWDPVENASFMPWLVGTALIHSLAVTEKRGLFKSWTLLLAISAFSLSLLGAFLVRSGILVSVHAFATDPQRGIFILAFLTIVIGGALLLYAWRAPSLDSQVGFKPLSRETFLLLNNVLLVIAATLILIGTLSPLVMETLNLGKISIGAPWFEIAFIIPTIPLVFLIGVGMHASWKSELFVQLTKKLKIPAVIAIIIGALIPVLIYGRTGLLVTVGTISSMWVIFSSLQPLIISIKNSNKMSRSVIGMTVAHFGVGVFILGVTIISSFNIETDRRMQIGNPIEVAGYNFELHGIKNVNGPNFEAIEGEIEIRKNGVFIGEVRPQKRTYMVQQNPMTEAGILKLWGHDLFVALGEPISHDSWSVRIQYKPLIRFIWLGCIIMGFGGLIAISDTRYRRRTKSKI